LFHIVYRFAAIGAHGICLGVFGSIVDFVLGELEHARSAAVGEGGRGPEGTPAWSRWPVILLCNHDQVIRIGFAEDVRMMALKVDFTCGSAGLIAVLALETASGDHIFFFS
jgi:hypothetical protein